MLKDLLIAAFFLGGILLPNLCLAFNLPRKNSAHWADLWGFVSELCSLPIYTWFLLNSTSATASWIFGMLLVLTILLLVVQYVRRWKTPHLLS